MPHEMQSTWKLAIQVTLHCLLGCASGEILGLLIGTAFGWSNVYTVILAVGLAFIFGYTLAAIPLRRAKMPWRQTIKLVFLAETLSILTMEVVDNGIMLLVPNSMNSINSSIFWITMISSLIIAFAATVPVNKWLLSKNKGHSLLHQHH